MSQKQFEFLAGEFSLSYFDIFGKTVEERQENGPKEAQLKTPEDLLFFVLFSFKTGLTEDVLGFIFGIDRSNVSRNRHLALRILRATLNRLGLLPKREFKDVREFETYFIGHTALILDGTEHRIQRPQNQEEQKDCYSGKKNVTQ